MSRFPAMRIVAALAVVLVLGIGRGTGALWNDVGAVPGGTIHTGRIDLRVDGLDAVTNYAPLDLPRLVPGQTAATVITVSNQGNVPLQWTASTAGTNAANGLFGALQVLMTSASSPTGATCGGTALSGTPRTLGAGESEQVCVQVGLPAGASSTLAAKATDLTITARGSLQGWSDTVDVRGVNLSTVALVPPTVTCSGAAGVNLTMTWTEVPGAKEYRVFDLLGHLLSTVPAGGLLKASLGGLLGGTVKTVYGSEWVSAGAGC